MSLINTINSYNIYMISKKHYFPIVLEETSFNLLVNKKSVNLIKQQPHYT